MKKEYILIIISLLFVFVLNSNIYNIIQIITDVIYYNEITSYKDLLGAILVLFIIIIWFKVFIISKYKTIQITSLVIMILLSQIQPLYFYISTEKYSKIEGNESATYKVSERFNNTKELLNINNYKNEDYSININSLRNENRNIISIYSLEKIKKEILIKKELSICNNKIKTREIFYKCISANIPKKVKKEVFLKNKEFTYFFDEKNWNKKSYQTVILNDYIRLQEVRSQINNNDNNFLEIDNQIEKLINKYQIENIRVRKKFSVEILDTYTDHIGFYHIKPN